MSRPRWRVVPDQLRLSQFTRSTSVADPITTAFCNDAPRVLDILTRGAVFCGHLGVALQAIDRRPGNVWIRVHGAPDLRRLGDVPE
jgi:hypothetical protein